MFFTVWGRLEQENTEFFRAYNIRLKIKQQILDFNNLVQRQAALMQQQGVVVQGNNTIMDQNMAMLQGSNATAASGAATSGGVVMGGAPPNPLAALVAASQQGTVAMPPQGVVQTAPSQYGMMGQPQVMTQQGTTPFNPLIMPVNNQNGVLPQQGVTYVGQPQQQLAANASGGA